MRYDVVRPCILGPCENSGGTYRSRYTSKASFMATSSGRSLSEGCVPSSRGGSYAFVQGELDRVQNSCSQQQPRHISIHDRAGLYAFRGLIRVTGEQRRLTGTSRRLGCSRRSAGQAEFSSIHVGQFRPARAARKRGSTRSSGSPPPRTK